MLYNKMFEPNFFCPVKKFISASLILNQFFPKALNKYIYALFRNIKEFRRMCQIDGNMSVTFPR